ncbi:sugar ABC transporter permease, partial [Ochrobactrum sp. GRS2]|nr:sugar ABC transporter permease [Ochrobactrum sp. GRS2]
VGLKHFELLFSSTIFWQVLANTLIISAMKIVFVFPVPIIVALLLNEVRGTGTRKFIQSAIYLPHFLSWVVIAGIFIAVLSPSTGAVNEI